MIYTNSVCVRGIVLLLAASSGEIRSSLFIVHDSRMREPCDRLCERVLHVTIRIPSKNLDERDRTKNKEKIALENYCAMAFNSFVELR